MMELDTTDFYITEYFVGLKPKQQWRPLFHQDKDKLISSMDRELEKIPGVTWSFSQPIADDMEEAISGVKGELAVKIYGPDLKVLEAKGGQIVNVMRTVAGIEDLALLRVLGQPNLNLAVDRDVAARFQINVADVQDAIQTAVGGNAVSQVLQGEQRFDLVARYLPAYRGTPEAIERIRLLSPSGERVSLAQLCRIRIRTDRRFPALSRRKFALHRHQIQRARPRSGRHGGRGHRQGGTDGPAAGGLPAANSRPGSMRVRSVPRGGCC